MKKTIFEYKELGEQVMIENAMSDIIAEYMIENSIENFEDLTEDDIEAIEELKNMFP